MQIWRVPVPVEKIQVSDFVCIRIQTPVFYKTKIISLAFSKKSSFTRAFGKSDNFHSSLHHLSIHGILIQLFYGKLLKRFFHRTRKYDILKALQMQVGSIFFTDYLSYSDHFIYYHFSAFAVFSVFH